MPITSTSKIWMNGDLVDGDPAQAHIQQHSSHDGGGVVEGIRASETSQGPAFIRLTEHVDNGGRGEFGQLARRPGDPIPRRGDPGDRRARRRGRARRGRPVRELVRSLLEVAPS